MSLILKGVDMPEVNETRMIAITQNGVAFFSTVKEGETSKSEKAEAIQIPTPHGRLIDGDELKSIKSIQSADFNSIETIQKWIDEAPTILEAEE